MKHPVIVLGGGGHSRVLIDILRLQNYEILGIIDPNIVGKEFKGIKIINNDEEILKYSTNEIRLVNGIGSTKSTKIRSEIYKRYKGLGYSFATIIHPYSILASDIVVSEGVQIMAGVIIQTGTVIGENVIINTKASIDHDSMVHDNVHIAPGVTASGGVQIGKGTHVGTGAIIIQGINIGDNVIIGAGSVIIRDISNGTKVVGNPAREVY